MPLCELTHLTAVSGANLTLLLAFLLTVARWLGVRSWWLRVVGLAGVIISSPSVAPSRVCCGRPRWVWWLWLRWDREAVLRAYAILLLPA
jgi:hypothetical protein